ncbi:MAG: cbb3-type cytochrome oxidase assembly protein CcoS [Hyphomicrobium sp.]|nr:cbb3-type cytochrome oxidase assembly protein CcoS [Hyphomicrobium sp.]
MTVLAWMLPAALALGVVMLSAFFWALRNGQFEDLEGAGWRILDDDIAPPSPKESPENGGRSHG